MPAHLLPIDRRRFLAASAISITAAGQSARGQDSQVEPDTWAILSDTHLLSADSIRRHYSASKVSREKRAEQASRNLDLVAAQVNALPKKPAGVLLNGDCVHVGGQDEYAQLATKFALFSDIPIHVTMGNHDQRDDFTNAFKERLQGERVLLKKRHVSIVRSRLANFVLLDSLTMQKPRSPVKGPGILGREQLDWLESALDSATDKPAIVMFHHNLNPGSKYQGFGNAGVVTPSSSPFNGLAGGLEDSDALLELLVSKPHVKAVVTGHMHQFRVFQWRNLRFVSLPAVGYTFHAKEPVAWSQWKLQKDGAHIELRTLDTAHARDRHRVELSWS